jgi:hypothetical protein
MAELIALPSLAMSPMAFSAMASDLRRASLAWFRVDASCSRDARDCSSSAWTSEEQARTRSHGGLDGKKKKNRKTTPKFKTYFGATPTRA